MCVNVSHTRETMYILSVFNFFFTQVYASSEPFEIKALGSSYPTTTSSVGSSATSSSASASSTTTGGALAQYAPVGMGMAAALALGLVVA